MRSFEIRPPQNSFYRRKEAPQPSGQAGFSPLLNGLLACTLKDNFCRTTAFSLLRDLYPYTEGGDRTQIDRLLEIRNGAGQIAGEPARARLERYSMKRPLTQRDRLFGMMRVLKRYGGRESASVFAQIERVLAFETRLKNASSNPLSMLGLSGPMNLASMMGGLSGFPGMGGSSGAGGFDPSMLAGMLGGRNSGPSGAGGLDPSALMGMFGGMQGGAPDMASLLTNLMK